MSILNLRVVTTLKYLKQVIKETNNFTYVVDPSYPTTATRGLYANTAPFAFFSVTSDTLSCDADVSEKRIILYADDTVDQTGYQASVVSVMSDNFVPKPTVREIECIVPYTTIFPLTSVTISQLWTMAGLMDTMFSENSDGVVEADLFGIAATATIASNAFSAFVMSFVQMLNTNLGTGKGRFIKLLQDQASSFLDILSGSISSAVAETFSIGTVVDYNKDSLVNMWRRGALLRMKTWRGNQYVYGSIRNLKIWKKPTEEGNYRASFQFVERPLLYIGNKIPETGEFNQNSFVEATNALPQGDFL